MTKGKHLSSMCLNTLLGKEDKGKTLLGATVRWLEAKSHRKCYQQKAHFENLGKRGCCCRWVPLSIPHTNLLLLLLLFVFLTLLLELGFHLDSSPPSQALGRFTTTHPRCYQWGILHVPTCCWEVGFLWCHQKRNFLRLLQENERHLFV